MVKNKYKRVWVVIDEYNGVTLDVKANREAANQFVENIIASDIQKMSEDGVSAARRDYGVDIVIFATSKDSKHISTDFWYFREPDNFVYKVEEWRIGK